jgi:hypothetical protein
MGEKKKSLGRMVFFTCLCVLFFTSYLYAAANTTQKATNVNQIKTNQKPTIANPLPDLIVKDVSLTNNCSIKFAIQNIGQAGVAATTYLNTSKGFLKIYDGTKLLVDLSLKDADPYKRLRNAGGSEFGVALPGNYNPVGTHTIKVVIDEINIVTESNENNNTLTKTLACSPLQIKQLSIGSDAAGNCFVHIFLNKDANKNLPLSASKISLSNRSHWDKIEWGDAQTIFLTSYKNSVPYNSTCPAYPCTIHVSIDSTFVQDPAGGTLDGDYNGIPGGNFIQDITVSNASAWGVFKH